MQDTARDRTWLVTATQAAYEDKSLLRSITTTDWWPFKYEAMLTTEDEQRSQERFQQLVDRCNTGDRQLAFKKAKVKIADRVSHCFQTMEGARDSGPRDIVCL